MKKYSLLIVALILGMGTMSSCSRPSMDSDIIGVHYEGGPASSKKFDDCFDPSSAGWIGYGDNMYRYPTSQRSLTFPDKEDRTEAITFVTKDGIEMSVSAVVNFRLNTDCTEQTIDGKKYKGGVIQYFHELIGKRYKMYFDDDGTSSDGWIKGLGIYMARPIDTAVDRAAQDFTYSELYFNPAKKAEWEKAVLTQLPDLVDRQTDGEVSFFQDFAITLQKPDPPKAIKDALVLKQQAIVDADAAVAKAEGEKQVAIANAATAQAAADADVKVAEAKAKAQRAVIDGFGGYQNYLYYLMSEKGLNPFQPTYGSAIVQPKP